MVEKLVRQALIACFCMGIGATYASEDAVKQGIEAFIGANAVTSVTGTPYGELYEVLLDNGELYYTDGRVSFIIDGQVIDTRTRVNVTQLRLNELSRIDFAKLSLGDAIKQVKGDGERIVVTFEDPNCGYCKRFAQELAKMDNLTVYTFLYPILGEDSNRKSRDIWCSEDPAQAWNGWLLDGKAPAASSCDSAAVDRNVVLGRKHRVQGTPTVYLTNGQRIGGYLTASELEDRLAAVAK